MAPHVTPPEPENKIGEQDARTSALVFLESQARFD